MEKQRKKELVKLLRKQKNPRLSYPLLGKVFLGWRGFAYCTIAYLISSVSFVFMLLFVAISVAVLMFLKSIEMKNAVRNSYFLCPWCRYSLKDLTDHELCPECGVEYTKKICEILYRCEFEPRPEGSEKITKRQEKWAWARAIRLRDQES